MPSFYDKAKWKETRNRILRRDEYLCQECKRYGRMRQAVVVHHKEHLDEHPEKAYDPENLVSLCAACHNKAHPEKRKDTRRR